MAPRPPPPENIESSEAHPMNSGNGPNSYSQNSSYQRGVIDAAKSVISEAIAEYLSLEVPAFNSTISFKIADLGCSTGPNTFLAAQNIVEALDLKHRSTFPLDQCFKIPEFQVFFNDHADNDFNVLFRNLPPSRQYLAAGVPGSFYTRLFPKGSLHVVHSSYALHWLSKVPNQVRDRESPAWNKGKVHYHGGADDKEVTMAYYGQFQKDMDKFLKARAEEVVEGGLVLLQLPSVPNGALFSQTGAGMLHLLLGSCLLDLAHMGVIKSESIDSFNLPQYHPTMEELEMLVEMNNYFTIEKMCTLSHPMKHLPFDVNKTCTQVRAIMEGLIEVHFGTEIVDQLFELYTRKLEENYEVFDKEIHKDVDLFVVLKRRSN